MRGSRTRSRVSIIADSASQNAYILLLKGSQLWKEEGARLGRLSSVVEDDKE